uniref:(northern house mosquito) hypothetical protein n=1 Tax=Culex pipiens TaxID=7175 RepID=A0A8D8BSH9_CULPI
MTSSGFFFLSSLVDYFNRKSLFQKAHKTSIDNRHYRRNTTKDAQKAIFLSLTLGKKNKNRKVKKKLNANNDERGIHLNGQVLLLIMANLLYKGSKKENDTKVTV